MEFDDKILGYDINEDFKKALDLVVNQSKNIFVSGSGGVGKSTFIEVLCSLLHNQKKTVVKLAPTGVAAVRIGGQTIHSFFKFPLGPLHIGRGLSGKENDENFVKLIQSTDILILDECSMIRSDIFENINHVLQQFKNASLPFGGAQVILVGDLFQLEPIVTDEDDKNFLKTEFGGSFFFETFSYREGGFQCIEFKKCYRQKDEEFKKYLNILRLGDVDKQTLDYFNSRVIDEYQFSKKVGGNYVHLVSVNKRKDEINEACLQGLDGKVFEHEAIIVGSFKEKDSLMEKYLRLKIGAQVMTVINKAGYYYNGSIGEVLNFVSIDRGDGEKTEILVEFEDGKKQYVSLFEQENFVYKHNKKDKTIEQETQGKITQYPLILAWARTTHKAQSATFEKVYFDCGNFSFAKGLVYVGLSRCKSYENLGLVRPIKGSFCLVDKKVKDFYQSNF